MRTIATILMLLFAVAACVPSPKDVRCSNQADCKNIDPRYGYCVQSRCVECLDDPGCGEGNVCRSGRCEHKCWDGRDCKSGQVCDAGICADRS